jgi:hypothetical protein
MRMQDALTARADAVVPAIASTRPANDRGEDLGTACPPLAQKPSFTAPLPRPLAARDPAGPSGCWGLGRARHYPSSH